MAEKQIVLVDLEGTLSDCGHRIHHWQKQDYDTWNELFPQDKPRPEVIDLVVALAEKYEIYIATAKPFEYYSDVDKWLKKHLPLQTVEILMRPDGNEQTSPDLKDSWVQALENEGKVIALAIDDREDVIDMYSEVGTPIVDVSRGFNPEAVINAFIKSDAPSRRSTVPDLLRESAAIYEERGKVYGESYKEFGPIMSAFFPNGVELSHPDDMNRHAVLTLMMAKMQRYCNNFHKGGHSDSLVDLSTYSAMLNELDGE